MPKVSVIVPNYNHAPFLQKRIESILNQTFQDFEIILFDDASTDESLEILNGYETHPKFSHIIVNTKNSGSPFVQWCRGIELALGDYIWIAETDDFAEFTFLEQTVLALQNNPNSNLVYVDSKIVDVNDNTIDLWSIRKNNRFKTTKWSMDHEVIGKNEVIDFLLNSVTINNASAVLFRKKSLNSTNFLNDLSTYKTVGDLYTYIFVALQGKISYIAQPLNNYREHELNVTKKNTHSGLIYLERIKCFQKSLSYFKNFDLTQNDFANLKESYVQILRKNGVKLIDLDFGKELDHFIKKIIQAKIFNIYKGFLYRCLFKLNALNSPTLKKVSKRLIKKVL